MKRWALFAAALMGCSQAQDLGSNDAGGAAGLVPPETGAVSTTSAADPEQASLTPHQICDQMLLCIQASEVKDSYGDFVALYGANGSCWNDSAESACSEGCVGEMHKQVASAGEGSWCDFCENDEGCLYNLSSRASLRRNDS